MTISIVQNELEHWYDHVARFVSSGKTQKEYCLANSLDYSQFKNGAINFQMTFQLIKITPELRKSKSKALG
jgi:hypothetical protein